MWKAIKERVGTAQQESNHIDKLKLDNGEVASDPKTQTLQLLQPREYKMTGIVLQ